MQANWPEEVISSPKLTRVIQDAIAQKRVIKWGYVRSFGGLYASECDTVAAHSSAVAALATMIGYEIVDEIASVLGVKLQLDDALLLATFHDLGEGRSGDTGASSHAVRGLCNLHGLEREGLQATVQDLKIEKRILGLFDDYRAYRTPESILVHIADNLEGFEKAVHASHGHGPIMTNAIEIVRSNIDIYKGKTALDKELGLVCNFMVEKILIPGLTAISAAYGINMDWHMEVQ